jgi:thiol-disulfide isomerase/thioredoxin
MKLIAIVMLAALPAFCPLVPLAAQIVLPGAPAPQVVEVIDLSQPTVTGIGIVLMPDAAGLDGMYRVSKMLPGAPAAMSGLLHEGDRLLAVAEEGLPPQQLTGRPYEEVAGLIRGLEGSAVRLTVVPALRPVTEARDVTLLRARLPMARDLADPNAEVEPPPAESEPVPAPPLSFLRLGDQQQRSSLASEQQGKLVVLTFWATWSDACAPVMTKLQKTAAKFADRKDKVSFLTVAIDGSADSAQIPAVIERVANRLKEKSWTHTTNAWAALEEHRNWRLVTVPTTFIVRPDGLVIQADAAENLDDVITVLLDGGKSL